MSAKKKPTNRRLRPNRHPAIAQDAFFAAHPEISRVDTLGTEQPNYYLKNRITVAFQAGWDAAEKHHRK